MISDSASYPPVPGANPVLVCSTSFAPGFGSCITVCAPNRHTWTGFRRFIRFHGNRHPSGLDYTDVMSFLTDLASHQNVASSTQNQAQSAMLFLYREVFERELAFLDRVARAKTVRGFRWS